MIRPSNIDKINHTADFKCDAHGGSVEVLDLNTETSYDEDNTIIILSGSKLTDPCVCVTCFPTVNGNQDAQDLAEAKTA